MAHCTKPMGRSASTGAVARTRRVDTRRVEQIVVSEADFLQHKGNLAQLRKNQLPPASNKATLREPNPVLALSFKSAFRSRCRSATEPTDPWKGMANYETVREHSEADLILNQVWPRSPKKIENDEFSVLREACSLARCGSSGILSRPASRAGVDHPRAASVSRCDVARPKRSSSQAGLLNKRLLCSLQPTGQRRGSLSQCSTRPSSSGSDASQHMQTRDCTPEATARTPPQSRIRLRSASDDEDLDTCPLDMSWRKLKYITPEIRRYTTPLTAKQGPLSIWVSLNSSSGELYVFPREAARRLEGAYREKRRSVLLAGLKLPQTFEDDFVDLDPQNDAWETGAIRALQLSPSGASRDVRRIEVQADTSGVTVDVSSDASSGGAWRLADHCTPGVTERRWSAVGEGEIIDKDSALASLPPVRRARVCFINEGASMMIDELSPGLGGGTQLPF